MLSVSLFCILYFFPLQIPFVYRSLDLSKHFVSNTAKNIPFLSRNIDFACSIVYGVCVCVWESEWVSLWMCFMGVRKGGANIKAENGFKYSFFYF